MLAERAQTPLESVIISLKVFILHEIIVLLVYGVICQMHIFIILVPFTADVLLTGKSSQSFLVNIDTKRIK